MIFRFDAFALDTEGYVLNKGTEPVSVEPQAFRLLQFLVQNRDRVVGKDEMIDHVWEGRIISDAAITSAINLVRRAVGDNGKTQAIIKTFPRRGFRFVGDVTEEGDGVTMPSPIPALGKPSIAVLPFDNLSGDLDVEFFADGITEDIITEISKFRWFFVIARTSSFSYKGQSLDIRRIAEELGVRYVLEGSVRRVGNQVRITAQLVDGGTGNHLWAERYDRELNDVFAVQDEITQAIAGAVAPPSLWRKLTGPTAKRRQTSTPGTMPCAAIGISGG